MNIWQVQSIETSNAQWPNGRGKIAPQLTPLSSNTRSIFNVHILFSFVHSFSFETVQMVTEVDSFDFSSNVLNMYFFILFKYRVEINF